MSKYYNVYSYNLMRYLETLGFKVLSTKQMEENPRKIIWKYEYTEEIVEAVNYYVSKRKDKVI